MLLAQKEIRAQPGKFFTVPFVVSLCYSALIFIPIAGWYFYKHTGWSTAYINPEESFSVISGPLIFLQYFFGMFFGALLTQCLIQLDRMKAAYVSLIFGIIWLKGIWFFTLDQYLHVGTYAQYHQGVARRLFDDSVFQSQLNMMGIFMFGPAIIIGIIFFRRSTRNQ